ncbi:unnamed protein product [Gemmata massiliana]|uniref:Uncharacterized protein n=2 Tax=Gemmata massiliana TaxID=1210884 RepID=A0A6P2D034_9BACT|nr:unnamed protein product [Gemmata massiliana]
MAKKSAPKPKSKSQPKSSSRLVCLVRRADLFGSDQRACQMGRRRLLTSRAVETDMVNASHHLKIMRNTELVTVERDGRFMIYALVGATMKGTRLELAHTSGAKVVLPLE